MRYTDEAVAELKNGGCADHRVPVGPADHPGVIVMPDGAAICARAWLEREGHAARVLA